MPVEMPSVISPWGGHLVDLLVPEEKREELLAVAKGLPSLTLSERSICDLELLAVGAFSPLDRFMGRADQEAVAGQMRLRNGLLFPVPVTLPVEPARAARLNGQVALRDQRGEILAIQTVEEAWEWSLPELARSVLGTEDLRHPLVAEMHGWGRWNLSGRLEVLRLPDRHDFRELRLTPSAVRRRLSSFRRTNVVAFQTHGLLHRGDEEMTKRALMALNATLLLHPTVGGTRPGDVDDYARVRAYKAVVERYDDHRRAVLALLPLATWMAGPREAVWHALIRRNFGANHLIVGRDHASPGFDSKGRPFYGPWEAQELLARYQEELGVRPVRSEWFLRPQVASLLAEALPARHHQGVCVWLTGLPAAGKSSIAEALTSLLLERGRQVTLLDGDVVRTHLSKGLGFSKDDRDTNVRRIGFVASEIVRHGGLAVCAAVSPYRIARNEVRNLVGADQMVEVYVATPLEVCETRDTKGLYAKARKGEILEFTGIDDPYEAPVAPEVTVDSTTASAESGARTVLRWLVEHGFVLPGPARSDLPPDD
jgi:sulfate adenylyltransferase